MKLELELIKYKGPKKENRTLSIRIPDYTWMGLATIMLLVLGNNNGIIALTTAAFMIMGVLKEGETK